VTSDSEITVTGIADPGGVVTLTGALRYLGDTGAVDANGDAVYGVLTYNLNQAVAVNSDGSWSAELVFGAEMGVDLAGEPITLVDTGRQPGYGLTATWSKTGASSFSDSATVEVDSVAPDLLTQAVDPTSERQVNSFVKNNQMASRAVGLEDGGYVIVWASNGQDSISTSDVGVYGQRYDASGNRLGAEFRVATSTICPLRPKAAGASSSPGAARIQPWPVPAWATPTSTLPSTTVLALPSAPARRSTQA